MTLKEYKLRLKEISDEYGVDFEKESVRFVIQKGIFAYPFEWVYLIEPNEDVEKLDLRKEFDKRYNVFEVCYNKKIDPNVYDDFQVVFNWGEKITLKTMHFIPWDAYSAALGTCVATIWVKAE